MGLSRKLHMQRYAAAIIITASIIEHGHAQGRDKKIVPLKSVIVNFQQENAGVLPERLQDASFEACKRIRGGANIFLVYGDTLDDAIEATRFAYGYASKLNTAIAPPEFKSSKIWACVYFTSDSSEPPVLRINEFSVADNRITAKFSRIKSTIGASDIHPYVAWVDLGEIVGRFECSILDADSRVTEVMRSITVPEAEK